MRPSEVVRRAAAYLERHDVDAPTATAEVLLASVLGTDRTGLYRRSEGLSSAEARTFGRALCRRCAGVPVQHLTGEQGFRRLVLAVRSGVFVPRPETEGLVEAGLEAIAGVERPVVVDVGTGSGAVGLAVADERPDARVLATDRSPEAVALARENAAVLGLAVEVLAGDLLDALPASLAGRVDLVISNPPYVEEAAFPDLPPEVRADPPGALLGEPAIYERLAAAAAAWLRAGAALAVEIGETQGGEVAAILDRAGYADIRVRPDLAGRDRVVTASWP